MALDLPALRAFAADLADRADALSLAGFGGPVPATAKADGTPVTEVDTAIEEALRRRIAEVYPEHEVLGEEQGGGLHPERPTWVIDPIDGTKNFMRGVPVFATLIALVVGGRAVVGVASAPAMAERWEASTGGGAYRNGERIGVSAVATLAEAHVLFADAERFRAWPPLWEEFGRLHDETWRMRAFGDYYNHLLVAAGCADAAFEREIAPWDVAALEVVVTEAGGRITDFHGRPPLEGLTPGTPNGVLTTNGPLHESLLPRLAACVPTREADRT